MLPAALATDFPVVSLFCFGLSLAGAIYAFFATLKLRAFAVRQRRTQAAPPSVTLLKPLCGDEPNLAAALATFCAQEYESPVQIVFGVQSYDDAAIPVIERLRRQFPDRDIELVVDATQHGANRKVSNLINMSARIRHDLVVLADSDIVVEPTYLRTVAAEFENPRTGLVTCLYRGLADAGVWSRLTALAINLHFMPSVLVGMGFGLAKPCFGSTIALRRRTLNAIGGFSAFADRLADDYAMGEAVRGLGLEVAIPSIVVGHLCQDMSLAAVLRHELRWARTVRLIDFAGFLGTGVTHAVPFALLGLLSAGPGRVPLTVLGLALAARLWLAASARRVWSTNMPAPMSEERIPPILPPALDALAIVVLRDLLSFLVFAGSFFAVQVRWRNFDYKVASNGVLSPLEESLNDANAVPASSVL